MSLRRVPNPALYFVAVVGVLFVSLAFSCHPEAVDFEMEPLPNGQVGEPYEAPMTSAAGFVPDEWYAPVVGQEVVPGIVHAEPGMLRGTPSEAGKFIVSYSVYGNRGFVPFGSTSDWEASGPVFLIVKGAPLKITADTLADATVEEDYEQELTASGGAAPYAWSVVEGTLPTGLSLSDGVISGTPTVPGAYDFTVRVTSGDEQETSARVTIVVTAESLRFLTGSLPAGIVGDPYSEQLEASGGGGEYVWARESGSLPPGLELTSDGQVSGTPTEATPSSGASFEVRLESQDGSQASRSYTIDIHEPLRITTESLPAATRGEEYSSALEAVGGTAEKVWEGTAPPGLEITSDGSITGTPEEAAPDGDSLFVEVQSGGQSASRRLELVVTHPPLEIVTEELPDASRGDPYSEELQAAGGDEEYVWSIDAAHLPDGLDLLPDGHIEGTPEESGSFSFAVRVVSGDGQEAVEGLSLTVEGDHPDLQITGSEVLANGVEGEPYSDQLTATGGDGNYTWSHESGVLPPGVTVSSDGSLSGTPGDVGGFDVTIGVTSGDGQFESQVFSIVVYEDLTVSTAADLGCTVEGESYSQQLSADGGDYVYSWALTGGSLASGLSLAADGEISGTPTDPGTVTFDAEVTSGDGQTAVRSFTLEVAEEGVGCT